MIDEVKSIYPVVLLYQIGFHLFGDLLLCFEPNRPGPGKGAF
jgi:hypothetical protein